MVFHKGRWWRLQARNLKNYLYNLYLRLFNPHHRETNVYSPTFQLIWEPKRKLIAHRCCDQLTAVKTGYPLTIIIWPYRRLKCQPIEVKYFFKLSADKLPVSDDRWLKFIFFQWFIWNMLPRTRKFSQVFKNTGREDLFLPWSLVVHALRPIFML